MDEGPDSRGDGQGEVERCDAEGGDLGEVRVECPSGDQEESLNGRVQAPEPGEEQAAPGEGEVHDDLAKDGRMRREDAESREAGHEP